MLRFAPFQIRTSTLCLGSTALLGATVFAASSAFQRHLPPVNGDTPQQVAETLDHLVQPRFQQNAGQFGVDRVINLDGHTDIHDLHAESPGEQRLLRRVYGSHRSVVVAFLHVRHKPGVHKDDPTDHETPDPDFKPSVEALACLGASQSGVDHTMDWADMKLTRVVLPSLPALRRGQGQTVDYQNWLVVMRPVLATHASCVGCHEGARRGDTLGVMVYAVDKNAKIGDRNFYAPSGV